MNVVICSFKTAKIYHLLEFGIITLLVHQRNAINRLASQINFLHSDCYHNSTWMYLLNCIFTSMRKSSVQFFFYDSDDSHEMIKFITDSILKPLLDLYIFALTFINLSFIHELLSLSWNWKSFFLFIKKYESHHLYAFDVEMRKKYHRSQNYYFLLNSKSAYFS